MSMSIHGLTYSFMNNFLLLVAMFQLIFITVLLRLGLHLGLHITFLDGDRVTFLILHRVGNNNSQLLTDLLHLGLALLLMHGLGNILALLHRLLVALVLLVTMFIMMLGTVKLPGENALLLIDNLLLLPAFNTLHLNTIHCVVMFHVNIMDHITDSGLLFVAFLSHILVMDLLGVNMFVQITLDIFHMQTLVILDIINNDFTIRRRNIMAHLVNGGVALLLHIGLAHIFMQDLLHLMAMLRMSIGQGKHREENKGKHNCLTTRSKTDVPC